MVRTHILVLMILGVLIVPSATALAASSSSIVQDVKALVQACIQAHNSGDVESIVKLYSVSQHVSSAGNYDVETGPEAIRAAAVRESAQSGNLHLTVDSVDVQALGSSYALAVARFSDDGGTADAGDDIHGILTVVAERVAGQWKILHDHFSFRVPTANDAK